MRAQCAAHPNRVLCAYSPERENFSIDEGCRCQDHTHTWQWARGREGGLRKRGREGERERGREGGGLGWGKGRQDRETLLEQCCETAQRGSRRWVISLTFGFIEARAVWSVCCMLVWVGEKACESGAEVYSESMNAPGYTIYKPWPWRPGMLRPSDAAPSSFVLNPGSTRHRKNCGPVLSREAVRQRS